MELNGIIRPPKKWPYKWVSLKVFTVQPVEEVEKSPDSAMLRGIAVEVEGAPQGCAQCPKQRWDRTFRHTWNGSLHL